MATGFNIQQKGFLFGSTSMLANYYVVGSDDSLNHYTLWQIQKLFDDSSSINYGDFVYLKNLSTKYYMIYEFDKQSEISGQIMASLTQNKQANFPFYLQPQDDKMTANSKFTLQIQQNTKLKLKTTRINSQLHSHNKTYSYKQVKNYNEVSCSAGDDENNLWEIVKLDANMLQLFDLVQITDAKNNQLDILDSDKIIIRNFWTGYSLHSHRDKYLSTNQQEVTCYSYERDVNDWWVIQLVFHMESSRITNSAPVKLVHQQTIQYLTVDVQNQAKSKNGYQVRCTPTDMQQQLIVSTLDNQDLAVGKPFFIFFPQMNRYLCQGPAISEMQKTQYEVIMVDKFSSKCCWVIEKKIK